MNQLTNNFESNTNELPDQKIVPQPVSSSKSRLSEVEGEYKLKRSATLYLRQLVAAEISKLSRYCQGVTQWRPIKGDDESVLAHIDCKRKSITRKLEDVPSEEEELILLDGNINFDFDIQSTLTFLANRISRSSRIELVIYNPYLRSLYKLLNRLGLRSSPVPATFVTKNALNNLCRLANVELVRYRAVGFFPFRFFGIGNLINQLFPLIPVVRWFSYACVVTVRPIKQESELPSLSIIIPARNEKGNIEGALDRMPDFGTKSLEVIFVEGNSNDGTWEEIQRVIESKLASGIGEKMALKSFKQTGKGKGDAVRLGFKEASGELITILDADLTMPPEMLPRFYEAYCRGLGDFINGDRLTYPMESEAMRFLNLLGNQFFAKTLSYILGSKLGDSLCGTKLLRRKDYLRMCSWREDFGDFDPFGDFELLFPASVLGLGIIDIPVRYRDRVYGTTNIRRFYHGVMLLKMTLVGITRIGLGSRVVLNEVRNESSST